ncbi:MAG: IclR family transcriptional regulator [Alphaproteobacteria bacterium]|nr:IclR family transcriptional regulator [Alphaproteobacteria bacterium]
MTDKDPYLVPGLLRGLAILQLFSPQHPELTLSQLARGVGVSRSAAFRTVYTLVQEGYLLTMRDSQHYRLGPAVLRLGEGFQSSRELLEVAQPALASLRDQLDWSAHLGVIDGRHLLYLVRQPASDGLSSLIHVGTRLPAATTAMGRVLLARKSEADIGRIFGAQDPQMIKIIKQNRLEDKQADYIVHAGDFERGLCSVAAPVLDMSGQAVAAISATKMTDQVSHQIIEALLKTAATISKGLGWQPGISV